MLDKLISLIKREKQKIIVVVRGYEDVSPACKGLKNCTTYYYSKGTGDINLLKYYRDALIEKVFFLHGIKRSNISIVSNWNTQDAHCCIIEYINAKGSVCETRNYAVGFGLTKEIAESNARLEMRQYYNGADFMVAEQFSI